jgi:hypothetical protein
MNVNTRSKPLSHVYPLNLGESLPPPHPSSFTNRKYDERSNKNQDLKVKSYDNKNEFLTVGRDSK